MSETDETIDDIIWLLAQQRLKREQKIELQNKLVDAGFTRNFELFTKNCDDCEPDGIIGAATLEDICNLCVDNPRAILSLSQERKADLINYGFGPQLVSAIEGTEEPLRTQIKEHLRSEANTGLNGRDISKFNHGQRYAGLAVFQANSALLGEYNKKVDGLTGPGSKAAFQRHKTYQEGLAATTNKKTDSENEYVFVGDPQNPDKLNGRVVPTSTVNTTDNKNGYHLTDYSASQESLYVDQSLYALHFNQVAKEEAEQSTQHIPTNGYGVPQVIIDNAWEEITGGKPKPFIQKASFQRRKIAFIDPGHYARSKGKYKTSTQNSNDKLKTDKGAVSPHNGLTEVDVVDPVAKALADKLYEAGYDVVFTRDPGKMFNSKFRYDASRTARPDFVNKIAEHYDYSCFISLHCNSARDQSANGARVYTALKGNNNNIVDFDRIKNPKKGIIADKESAEFTQHIAQNLDVMSKKTQAKACDATVISHFESQNGSNEVACLIELGFLSNKEDARRLANIAKNPESCAEQIAKGVLSYEGERFPAPQTQMAYQDRSGQNANMF